MLALNEVLQTQLKLNAQVAQIRQKLHTLVLANPKLKLREIEDELKIS